MLSAHRHAPHEDIPVPSSGLVGKPSEKNGAGGYTSGAVKRYTCSVAKGEIVEDTALGRGLIQT